MNRLCVIFTVITLNLFHSVNIFAGALSSSDAQQTEWTVRFDVKNTENEPVADFFWGYLYDENNNYAGSIDQTNPAVKLPNGIYSYSLYFNSLCQPTGSFTVKDSDKNVAIVLNKVRFHFSGQGGIENGLWIQITNVNDSYSTTTISTDNTGYSSINLLPGTYTYSAIQQNIEVAKGQFQLLPNVTKDVTVEITGLRLYTFYLKTSTGELFAGAAIDLYDSNGSFITTGYSDENGVIIFYLSDNKTYKYTVKTWNTYIQTDMKNFIVNEQNVSTTVMFYPVTFKLRKSDGSKFNNIPNFIFNNTYTYAYYSKLDNNWDPVFFFPPGHYTYAFYLDSSYPGLTGSFDIVSSPLVVNYVDQTHEVRFEFKDADGNYLPGAIHIDDPYVDYSTWGETRPFSIHLPDGEYDCRLWSYSSQVEIDKKIIIAGRDTTIIINHHKMNIKITNNNNEPLDFYVSMVSEAGGTVNLNKIGTGFYSADVLNGNYSFLIAKQDVSGSYTAIPEHTIAIQDADTTLNFVLNQCRINLKTADGNIVKNAQISLYNENNEYLYGGTGEVLLYLPDGRYIYNINTSRYYYGVTDTFKINKEDKEITKFAYPVTFRVTLSNQIPVLNYDLSFNGYGAQPDQKDEYTSKYLLLQGEYEYAVSTKSLSGNYIYSKGKVKADSSKVIPVTFYSAEFSVKIDGNPIPGSKISLWQDDSYYYNGFSLYTNDDGKVRDYVSNGLYHYTVEPENGNSSSSGTFSADSQNVSINTDFYSVRFHIDQSSIYYNIYIKNTDSGEETVIWYEWNDSIVTIRLTPGHYIYNIYYNIGYGYYYDNPIFSEGAFNIDNKPVDINEYFLLHRFIISNPKNKYIYYFRILKNDISIMDTYINNMDTLMYYLPKGEYTYECRATDGIVSDTFKVENPGDITYILFDNTGIQTINPEDADFKIYPNPAKDMIWFDQPVSGEITISTPDGKTVFHQTLQQQKSLNISQLKKGIYMVKISDTGNLKTLIRKLIVK